MTRLGTIEQVGEKHVLRYERRLDHPVERVWSALTEPEELRGWLAAAEVDPVQGGGITLRWLNAPEDPAAWEQAGVEIPEDHDPGAAVRGTITRLEPPHLIEYETDQMGVMRWELRDDGDGCSLTFTNTIELPAGYPPEQTLSGWHIHLDHLETALAGEPTDWEKWDELHMPRWQEIRARYEAS